MVAGGDGHRCRLMLLLCPLLLSNNFCLFLRFLCLASCLLLVGLFRHDLFYLVGNAKLR